MLETALLGKVRSFGKQSVPEGKQPVPEGRHRIAPGVSPG
jgi:hypothetical protein